MKRTAYLYVLLLIVPLFLFRTHLLSLIHITPPSYPAAEAPKEVGKYVTIVGRVAEVSMSQKGTVFLDFTAPYPRQSFTAVVFASEVPRFVGLSGYQGLSLSITGRVDLYRGKPEIIVRSPNQVKMRR